MAAFNLTNVLIVVVVSIYLFQLYDILPSVLTPVVWTRPNKLPFMIGKLTPNSKLEKVVKFSDGTFAGPASFAFTEEGNAYVSLNDGTVGLMTVEGILIKRVFFTGGFMTETGGNGVSSSTAALMVLCNKRALSGELAYNTEAERTCGRPLGLRYRQQGGRIWGSRGKGQLYILDAYHGLFVLEITMAKGNKDGIGLMGEGEGASYSAKHLIHPNTPIHIANPNPNMKVDPVSLQAPKFYNDLDLADYKLYFSDSSFKFSRSENRQEALDGAPRGRVFEFDLKANRLTVLLCGLHFPNGLQLLDARTGTFIVAELGRFRILKVRATHAGLRSGQGVLSCAEDTGYLEQALIANFTSETKGGSGSGSSSSSGSSSNSILLRNNSGSGYTTAQQEQKQKQEQEQIQKQEQQRLEQFGVSLFFDSAPGIMDNIRRSPTDGLIYVGLGGKSAQPFSLLWYAYQSEFLRDFLGKFVSMKLVTLLLPRYGLVLVLREEGGLGEVVDTLHDTTGRALSWISHADINPVSKALWLGSYQNPYLGILSSPEIGEQC